MSALKSQAAQSVTVQRGTLRGRRIALPPAVHGHRHFTSSLMKEAFFQLVAPHEGGPFFDLCAGSGQMAVEALSRGFDPVHCVERDEGRLQFLLKELHGIGLKFHKKDFRRMAPVLASEGGVAYLDVPYTFWNPDGHCPHLEEFLLRLKTAMDEQMEEQGKPILLAIQSPVKVKILDAGLILWLGERLSQIREYRGHFLLVLELR